MQNDDRILPPGATTPVEIELDREGRRLRFVWADGVRTDFPWDYLRWRCPCAWCQGEGDQPGVMQGRTTPLTAEESEMVDVDLVGRYAVRPTWKDSHDTGMFTFRNLRGMAQQEGIERK